MLSRRLRRGVVATAAAAAIAGLWMMPVDDHVTGTFQMKPAERSEVRAPVDSFLRELNYEEGDWIASGAIVGQLAVPHLSSRTASKLAEIEETKANLRMLEVGSRPEAVAMQRARVQLAQTLRDRAQFYLNQALTDELQRMTKKIDERGAEVEFARSSYEKAEKLFSANVIHQTHLDRSKRDLQVYEAQYQQAVAERHARQASVGLQAQSELADREQYLADAQDRLSLMEAGTRQEEIDAARARLVRLTEELRYLEEAREQMVLRSAVTGMILSPGATELVGRYFKQGDLILEIGNPETLTVEIELPEKQFSRVQQDDRVVLKAVALPYQTYETKVDRIAPLVTAGETGNTAKVYGRLDRVDEMLVPGMSGYARIELGTRSAGPALLERFVRFIRTEFWW